MMEKPKRLLLEENQQGYSDIQWHNKAIDDYEAYNKWVLQPVVEVFEKYKDALSAPRYMMKLKFVEDMWKAIQETINRSRG